MFGEGAALRVPPDFATQKWVTFRVFTVGRGRRKDWIADCPFVGIERAQLLQDCAQLLQVCRGAATARQSRRRGTVIQRSKAVLSRSSTVLSQSESLALWVAERDSPRRPERGTYFAAGLAGGWPRFRKGRPRPLLLAAAGSAICARIPWMSIRIWAAGMIDFLPSALKAVSHAFAAGW